jgi:hypothetical protein
MWHDKYRHKADYGTRGAKGQGETGGINLPFCDSLRGCFKKSHKWSEEAHAEPKFWVKWEIRILFRYNWATQCPCFDFQNTLSDFASKHVVLTCLQAQSDGPINTSSKGGCVLTVKSL